MDFELVSAVFKLVGHRSGFPRKFLRLAHGDEACSQAISQRRTEDESARLNARNQVDMATPVVIAELVHEIVKSLAVLEQGREVVKQNSGLRIVRNLADEFLQVVHRLLFPISGVVLNRKRVGILLLDRRFFVRHARHGSAFRPPLE